VVWEIVFMLVLLKIPLVYLCMVVWWAIRAEPRDEQPTAPVRVTDTPDGDAPVRHRRTPPRGGRPGGRRHGARAPYRSPSRPHATRAEVRS
jgi:hypothetical protein